MLRMITYGDGPGFQGSNSILGTSRTPNNRCIAKKTAIDDGALEAPLAVFEYNRLVPVGSIRPGTVYTIRFLDKDGNVLSTLSIVDGGSFSPSDVPSAPEISGYNFTGWSPEINYTPNSSVDYRAQYEVIAPPHTGDPDQYFTITARTAGTINFNLGQFADPSVIRYRVSDGSKDAYGDYIFGDWVSTSIESVPMTITTTSLQPGYVVQWRGDASTYAYGYGHGNYSYFSSNDCQFDISNNLLTLLYDTDVDSLTPDQKTKLDAKSDYCFCGLFAECDKIINASDLYFPSYLVDGANTPEHHFTDMFRDCVNLRTANFYASSGKLLDSAYERMFLGCRSLTTAPHLPSTQLGPHCYQAMFAGCTSLVTAPELPATTLVRGCYDRMFASYEYSTFSKTYPACTSLNYIKMDAPYTTEWEGHSEYSVQHPLRNWADGITQSGTFVGDTAWLDDSEIPGNLPSSWKQ